MTDSNLNRRNFLFLACAVTAASATVPALAKQKSTFSPSTIDINTGVFKGRNKHGKLVRLRVKRSGRDFTVQDITGKNHPPRLYKDQGNNIYRYQNGSGSRVYWVEVKNSRQFIWSGTGWGTITMND